MNTLYYGDNLKILRDYIKDETVDLVYLDPPFNSNRNYNVLFKDESGAEAPSQIRAFEDTWHWHTGETAATYHELLLAGDEVSQMIEAFHSFIGNNQMMAYLVMMAIRLKELHRVLKPTGSLYLHCDPTASHYLKILLDTIFGAQNFQNEVVWKRSTAHSDRAQGNVLHYGRIHDIILYYTKTDRATRNDVYTPYSKEYVDSFYKHVDEKGRYALDNITGPGGASKGNPEYEFLGVTRYWRYSRERMKALYEQGLIVQTKPGTVPRFKRYLDETKGVPIQDLVDDILPLQSSGAERLGYPTQKPVALLERIISASSNEGDVVLDPFCGCGTTIAAAQKLNRQWIGIDITHLSIALQKYRLKDSFGMEPVGTKKKSVPPALAGGQDSPENPTSEPQSDATGDNAAAPVGSATPPAHAGGTDKTATATATYRIIGEPEDLDGARQLATEDRYQFQWWALSLIKARPLGGNNTDKTGKKGSDKGIDGTITFIDDNTGKARRVIVSVKSGHVNVAHIRDLGHVIDREGAAIGVYLTLEPPTRPMLTEAAEKGFYHSPGWNKDYPRLQILTVEDLLNGKQIEMPPSQMTFKQAEKVTKDADEGQGTLTF